MSEVKLVALVLASFICKSTVPFEFKTFTLNQAVPFEVKVPELSE